MPALPTGTVTFLFTDIEGSTRLLQSLGGGYSEAFEVHRRLLREAVKEFGGHEFETQGDGLFVAFPTARGALAAAVAAQRALHGYPWPEGAPVRVRMGLHTGQPTVTDSGYIGLDLHRTARICTAGHGGQILVSQTTRDLAEDELSGGVTLQDLGEHRLKDLSRRERLFQLVTPDLPYHFPPLRTLDNTPNNLPRQLTSFVGRERELSDIKNLLPRTPLLTLSGAGGSGKSRLALQVAIEVMDQYSDGVWFVQLAPLLEPGLVPQAVASALAIPEQRGRPVVDVLLGYLRHKTLLLMLDNAEHLLSACVDLVDALLRGCAGLQILVTSREPLRIEGERNYPVPPLSVPSQGILIPIATLVQAEAVQLFVDRATAARPSFALSEQNAAAVLQICQRLDGIPLALELAAARVKALSVERIAERLDDQFHLLTEGSRTAPLRHQTLRATMDWSYDLLAESERLLFGRLAVFAGTIDLEAAEAVCSDERLEASSIVDLLARLVEKSLVLVEDRQGEARYRLLEPVRQYALSRLQETDETPGIRGRHREVFSALAEQGHVGLASAERLVWRARIEADHDNIRATLRWSIDNRDMENAASLGAAMARFWVSRGFVHEAWTWLNELRQYEDQISLHTRAKLLNGVGLVAFEIGDALRQATEAAENALTLFRQLGDYEWVEISARLLGMIELERGRYERASALLEEAASLASQRGDLVAEAEALRQRGYLAGKHGDYALATQLLERSLAIVRPTGRRRSIGFTLGHLAQVYHYQGQSDRAIDMLQEALSHCMAAEHGTSTVYFLKVLGLAHLQTANYHKAAEAYRRCLALAREAGYQWAFAECLIGFGGLAIARGDSAIAVRLLAAAEAFLTAFDYVIPSADEAYFKQLVETVRRSMTPDDFTRAWSEGQLMTMDQAIECAQSVKEGL
ncbi:MAG: tetratricopeptide repeat protein [Armatimonadota bacterium]